jgi:DNA helicase-2/ATP-dependent DNA helicase PcrA
MTRAMKKLTLTHARIRFRFGEMSYQSPSRFLEEMGGGVAQTESAHRGSAFKPAIPHASPTREFARARKKRPDSDSHYFRDEQPDYDAEAVPAGALKSGTVVEHESFGRGRVVHVAGTGESLKAVVDFPGIGRKSLLLKYAKLKLV